MSIEVSHLTKRYKNTTAVDDATFTVPDGSITGFLGSNGAGKSTTMRIITGLDKPTSGSCFIDGVEYSRLPEPLSKVGALLDPRVYHPKRSARESLAVIAKAGGFPLSRVDEMLDIVGLSKVAKKQVGKFSMGMNQRLGIAASLLGDPSYVILDEPANGLDPEGIRWVRDFLLLLAKEGRTVMISSHQLKEIQEIATHLVIIARGRIEFASTMEEFILRHGGGHLELRTADPDSARQKLATVGIESSLSPVPGTLDIKDTTPEKIGDAALRLRIPIYGLSEKTKSLEDSFIDITSATAQYTSKGGK